MVPEQKFISVFCICVAYIFVAGWLLWIKGVLLSGEELKHPATIVGQKQKPKKAKITHEIYGDWWLILFPSGQNRRHVADIFKCIFRNEKKCVLIQIPLKLVPTGPVGIKSELAQVMA